MQGWDLAMSAVPVVAAGGAGLSASARRPGRRVTSGLQHFAAGVVIAAAALELLPEVVRERGVVPLVGFALGVAVMFGMRALTGLVEGRSPSASGSKLPLGLVGATAVDFLIDGLVLGAGFTAGGHTGVLLAIAIAIEYVFVGLSLAGAMDGESSRLLMVGVPVLLSVLTVGGALLGV